MASSIIQSGKERLTHCKKKPLQCSSSAGMKIAAVLSLYLCPCIKENRNGGSLVPFTFQGNFAVVVLYGVLHDGKAQAGAAGLLGMALIHTVKALKHLVLMFRGNADAGILHTQQNFTGFLRNGHFHTAARVIVLNGIVAEVVNDFVQ